MPRPITRVQLLLFAAALLCITCNKHLSETAAIKTDLIVAARSYIDSISLRGHPVNFRAAQPKTILWNLARVIPIGQSKGVIVPIVFDNALLVKANFVGNPLFHLNYLTQLLFYKDSTGRNTARVITAFPDSNYFHDPTRPFSGIKFIEDWLGHPIQKLLYIPNEKVKHFIPTSNQTTKAEVTETCYSITGYNYSPELDETVTWSEPAGCSVDYIDDGSPEEEFGGIGGSGVAENGGRSAADDGVNNVIGNLSRQRRRSGHHSPTRHFGHQKHQSVLSMLHQCRRH